MDAAINMSEAARLGAVGLRETAEEFANNAALSKMKSDEKLCLEFGFQLPDGVPLKGKYAALVAELIVKDDYYTLNKLKEEGVLVVLPYKF